MGSTQSEPLFDSNDEQKKEKNFRQKLYEKIILASVKQKTENKLARPIINSPDLEQFQKMFSESGNNIQKFFELVEARISDLYISLSKQTLQLMCQKKLRTAESKIYISEQILYTSMNILKILALKTSFKYNPDIVNKFNNLQLYMLGYMKAKYPRQNQNFVPGELMQEFKNFDFVQQPENDMLKQLKICFSQNNQYAITKKTKKLINKLIEEVDQKFPLFQQLLSQKVFVVTKQGKQYSVQNRIGRKIPETVEKFDEQDETSIDLKSPQVFRVIIKWVDDMQSYLLEPYEQIRQKDHFKTVNFSENQASFDYVTVDQIQNSLIDLQSSLEQQKIKYKNQLKTLKDQIQLFNHNLIKVLTKAERKQRYVPKREAEIIKYSMFNKKLLSWMIIEKLKIVLKKLIKVSEKFQQSIGCRVDLVKFNVTDLMRAMMVGNKYQIIKVFNNMKSLENQNIIKILKIKNRLETPLNDVMVIFKISSSFILCQLQLIMADTHQTVNQKLKNIQILNHFFYELERSPYGVMAELAALLSFKDIKTSFEQKITFQKISQFNLANCQQKHAEKVQKRKYQKNPFICSQCTQFYGQYQNHYIYKYCTQCNQYLCAKCILSFNKQLQQKYKNQAIQDKIMTLTLSISLIQQHKINKMNNQTNIQIEKITSKKNMKFLQAILKRKTICMREIAKKKNIVTYKQIQKYLAKQFPKEYYSQFYQNQKKTIYFAIGKFVGPQLVFIAMKKEFQKPVKQCFKISNNTGTIKYNYQDFIIIFPQANPQKLKQSLIQPISLPLFKNQIPQIKLSQNYDIIQKMITPFNLKVPAANVNIIFDVKKSQINANYEYGQQIKQFQHQSIQQFRKNLPNLLQTHQVIIISNQGIADKHLPYFSNSPWKNKMKSVSLNNNNIKNIDILLKQLSSLQKLIVSNNKIQNIKFTVKLTNLKKLAASSNLIKTFQGIQNIPNIAIINLQSNQLTQFQIQHLVLNKLKILNLKYNNISNFQRLTDKCYPELTRYDIFGDRYKIQTGMLNIPKLTHLHLACFNFKSLQIQNTKYLQSLTLDSISADDIKVTQVKNLKKLRISQFYYDNIEAIQHKINLFDLQFPQLLYLDLVKSYPIGVLPVLNMPNLKRLSINNTEITDYTNLLHSHLQNLEIFSLQYVRQIPQLPSLTCPNLKTIYIQSDCINKINFQQFKIPKLQKLKIGIISKQTQIKGISNLPIKILTLQGGRFKIQQKLQLSNLVQLQINDTNCQNLVSLNFPQLIQMKMTQCKNVNLKIFQTSILDNIKKLQFFNIKIINDNKIPILNLKQLSQLTISGTSIQDISNLALSNLPSLNKLNLQSNSIKKIPAFTFSKLQTIKLCQCLVNDVKQFSLSSLPSLKYLYLSQNKITQFPVLKLPNLVYANFYNCYIQSIDNLSISQLPNLITLDLKGLNNKIQKLSILNLPSLKKLHIKHKQLANIDNLTNSTLNLLQTLDLQSVKLTNPVLPIVNLLNSKKISIINSNISDISNLTLSKIPNLQQLVLNGSCVVVFPIIKIDSLSTITYSNTQQYRNNNPCLQNIQNLQFCILPSLQKIVFDVNRIKKLPQMVFFKLKFIYVTNNYITDVSQFKKSTLPSIQTINIYCNKIKHLPIGKDAKPTTLYMKNAQVQSFDELTDYAQIFENFFYNDSIVPQANWKNFVFKKLKIFQMNACCLKDIDNIFINKFENALEISFIDNQIVKAPKIIAPKLQKLFLNRNCIKDVSQFQKSQIPQATMISFQTNQIQKVEDFPFKSIKQVFLSHNKISEMTFFSKHVYERLTMVVLYNLKIQKLGKINAPVCQKVFLNSNCIKNLEGMKGSYLPNCKILQLTQNKITDISALNNMNLNKLQRLQLESNKIQQLPALTLPNLNLINVKFNPIKNCVAFLKSKLNLKFFYYSVVGNQKDKLIQQISMTYSLASYYDYKQTD